MVKTYRVALLAFVLCIVVSAFLPVATTRIYITLPQAGAPISSHDFMLLISLFGVMASLAVWLLMIVVAVGLFHFKPWARAVAVWGTAVWIGCTIPMLWWSPLPFAPLMTRAHLALLIATAVAWTLVLVLLRSAPVRARFTPRTTS